MRMLLRRLLSLAWPVSLARLGIMGMGVTDAIVVGQMAPDELPHQALGWAPSAVWLVTGIGMLAGVQVLAARALGSGDVRAAGAAWRRGLVVSAISGTIAMLSMWWAGERVFTFFGIEPRLATPSAGAMKVFAISVPLHLLYVSSAFFMEAIQRPLPSTWVMIAANIVNLVLNLILVPEHGAVGSAWATCGARGFLAVALSVWVLCMKDARKLGVWSRSATPSYAEFMRVGSAAALSQAAEASAFSGMTIIAGRAGAHAVASYQILLNILAVVFMVALGLATATTVLTSEAVGRDQPREAARASWAGLGLNSALMLVIGIGLMLFRRTIASAYTADPEVVTLVASLMPLAAASILVDGGQAVTAAALRAHRDNWFPTASHVLAYACVMPGLGLLLAEVRALGVLGLLHAILWASVLSVGVLAYRLFVLTRRTSAASDVHVPQPVSALTERPPHSGLNAVHENSA
jgi:multidrug resistance protein, MATE family